MTIRDYPVGYDETGTPLYDNTPTVVAVLAELHDRKLIVVRRNNEPGRGLLGLPGGYHMRGESWQQAGCREVDEETGYLFDPTGMRQIGETITDEYGNNLIIAFNSKLIQRDIVIFDPNEVQEVPIIDHPGEPTDWAFPLHYAAAVAWARSKTRI